MTIPYYTPSLMEPEALEALLIREKLAARLMETIETDARQPSKHYQLLIGARGTGKTHLVTLLYNRVAAQPTLRENLLVAWLREEEWGVTTFLEFLLRVLRAIHEEIKRRDVPTAAELETKVEALYQLPQETAERMAGKLLKETAESRTLLLLCENLDDLFTGLETTGQQKLRAYIQENPFWSIIATAQKLFTGVTLQKSPFYGFFRIHYLNELTLDEGVELLAKIARYKGDKELEEFIYSPIGRARIRAMHHLAGGNHRVYVIFSQFLTRESLDNLQEPLIQTLNDLTPYYQARMAWLSQQQRKIVQFLIDRRGAVSVKEIAQRCFISHQTTSSQLKILKEIGYVRLEKNIGREAFYEIQEPLMRLCFELKKYHGGPLRLFIDFLRIWYTPNELKTRLILLPDSARLEREYILKALEESEKTEDPRVKACLTDLKTFSTNGDWERALQATEEMTFLDDDIELRDTQILLLFKLGRYEEAMSVFDKADQKKAYVWVTGGLCLEKLGRFDQALISFKRATELDLHDPAAWVGLTRMNNRLDNPKGALIAIENAIQLGEKSDVLFFMRPLCLWKLNRWEEGANAWKEAIIIYKSQSSSVGNGESDEVDAFTNILALGTKVLITELWLQPSSVWQAHIPSLMEVYERNELIHLLSRGVVAALFVNNGTGNNETNRRLWMETWLSSAKDRPKVHLIWLQSILQVLDVLIRYRETKDERIRLELPIEERMILDEILAADAKLEETVSTAS